MSSPTIRWMRGHALHAQQSAAFCTANTSPHITCPLSPNASSFIRSGSNTTQSLPHAVVSVQSTSRGTPVVKPAMRQWRRQRLCLVPRAARGTGRAPNARWSRPKLDVMTDEGAGAAGEGSLPNMASLPRLLHTPFVRQATDKVVSGCEPLRSLRVASESLLSRFSVASAPEHPARRRLVGNEAGGAFRKLRLCKRDADAVKFMQLTPSTCPTFFVDS